MRANLLGYPALAQYADEYSENAAVLVETIRLMPSGGDKNDLKDAFSDSLRAIWALCCAIAGATMFLSVITKEYDLSPAAVQSDQSIVKGTKCGSEEEEGAFKCI
ncbi:hypothetical protein V500_08594 [Pseudogymnoascus sp. VKM F-4518 (FW-2643)]|nr:hypothetical protein V500_08594 [Pseudogymnoascus sp. VKM F-4518 (FW-2643)]